METKKKWYKWTYKTERDLQKMSLWLPAGRGSSGVWDGHVHTAIFKVDNQQGSTVYPTVCSMSGGSLDGREVGGECLHAYV